MRVITWPFKFLLGLTQDHHLRNGEVCSIALKPRFPIFAGGERRDDRESKKDMEQKAGLLLPSVIKIWPIEKESVRKTLCVTRDLTSF